MRVVAVGTRMPAWVRSACDDYLTRLKRTLPVGLTEVEPGPRRPGAGVRTAVETEGQRLLRSLRGTGHVIALDERGTQLSTTELANWLGSRMQEGRDLDFVIGGADGLAPEVLDRSNFTLALSRLTLPHALARVLLIEQLYRAHCILTHHPYHRA